MTGTDLRRARPGGGVRLEVRDAGVHLVYGFGSLAEAAEMCAFLRDFLPHARFEIEPMMH